MTQTKKYADIDINDSLIEQALNYIDNRWESFERYEPDDQGTLIGLPYPYIVPSVKSGSGFMFNEMYYWDSYFIAQALMLSGKVELADAMLGNLLYLAKRFGIIPNANRLYFTGRSQPPLLSSYILDVFEHTKDSIWLKESMQIAEKEYETVWTSYEQPNWRNVFNGLSRYYDINLIDGLAEAESGWDMTTRFKDQCLSYVPIDLNCLLYKYEMDFAKVAELQEDNRAANIWQKRASERAQNINRYLWDPEKLFFFDYNYKQEKLSTVWSLAAYYSLWSGLASAEQASHLASHLSKFMETGGLATTTKKGIITKSEHNHQWAYPNGWAPLHWFTVKGLEKYGYHELAETIAKKWLETNYKYFERHGVFREAYKVTDPNEPPDEGLYPPQIGFGWTNAVFVDFAINYTSIGKKWQEQLIGEPLFLKRFATNLKKILTDRKLKIPYNLDK